MTQQNDRPAWVQLQPVATVHESEVFQRYIGDGVSVDKIAVNAVRLGSENPVRCERSKGSERVTHCVREEEAKGTE